MQSETREKLIFGGICLIMIFIIYGQTLLGGFVFDDRGILDHRSLLENLKNIDKTLSLPYWIKEVGLYRPVTLATYSLNFALLGPDPAGFHLINLLIYTLSGYWLFLLIKNLFGQKTLAYLSAVLFLTLPIHTEAVANIVGRAELLALFFSLMVLLELTKEKISAWKMGLWFLLAIGSKETAIATLPIVFIIILIREKEFFKKEIIKKYFYPLTGLFIGALTYFTVRFFVLGPQYFFGGETSIVENPLKFVPILPRLATAFKIFLMYITKSFWPFGLCPDYSYNQIAVLNSFWNYQALLGAALFLAAGMAAIMFLKKAPVFSLATAYLFFGYLTVSNLLFPIGTIAGERLMYFPSTGLCLFLGGIIYSIKKLKPSKFFTVVFWIISAAVILFYSIRTYIRAQDWLDEKRLFVSAVQCAPNSALSHSSLGAIYYLEGDYKRAEEELLLSQKIYDGYPKGINNLGLVYWKKGQREKAREYFLRALSFKFPYYGAYENLALMALEENKTEEAKDWLLKFCSGDEKTAEMYIKSYFLSRQTEGP